MIKILYSLAVLLCASSVVSQQRLPATQLSVSDKKTTHLVFPYAIIAGDCGSPDVRAQKMKGVNNVLQVKAVAAEFSPTNLTVITEEGKLYPFELRYEAYPAALTLRFEKDSAAQVVHTLTYSPRLMEEHSRRIVETDKRHRIRRITRAGLDLQLNGIYTDNQLLYYHLSLANRSALDYNIEAIRCTMEDRPRSRRSVRQVMEVFPLLTYGDYEIARRDSTIQFVVTIAKKTLRRTQRLFIRLIEQNGARHVFLTIKPKDILGAQAL